MIVNKGNWQIAQITGERSVTIYRDGQVVKTMAAKKDLKANELTKILNWYME